MKMRVSKETIISLEAARKKFPKECSRSFIDKAWRSGINGKKLSVMKMGGRRFTSEEAVQRFIESITEERDGE
jgi:hypothetical protein